METTETANPEIKVEEFEENEKPYFDEYEAVRQRVVQAYQNQKGIAPAVVPETSIETAHVLLQNSETSKLMPEIDKEIKLSNLDQIEKNAIWQFNRIYQDLKWLEKEQEKKAIEAKLKYKELHDFNNEENLLEEIEEGLYDETYKDFDGIGALRNARSIASLSRGKFGFEREMQVKTIINSSSTTQDKTESKPGFLKNIFGGFKK